MRFSPLAEDDFVVGATEDGDYAMVHKSHGKLFVTYSLDPDNFDPNDAEEISDAEADEIFSGFSDIISTNETET